LHTEVSISEEEVKIPLPEELYEKVKGNCDSAERMREKIWVEKTYK